MKRFKADFISFSVPSSWAWIWNRVLELGRERVRFQVVAKDFTIRSIVRKLGDKGDNIPFIWSTTLSLDAGQMDKWTDGWTGWVNHHLAIMSRQPQIGSPAGSHST